MTEVSSLLDKHLEQILENDVSALIESRRAVFDEKIVEIGESYVLFGAGELGKIGLEGLRRAGIEPICFADNNPGLWGTKINGLEVLSPEDSVQKYARSALYVITVYTSQPVWEQLAKLGTRAVSFAEVAWKYPNAFLPFNHIEYPNKIYEQADSVRRALLLWADETSRKEYLGQLAWRTTLDRSSLPPHLPKEEIYFLDDLIRPLPDEVMVDCGAFDGDTILKFVKRRNSSFKAIIAIEPDPINFNALKNNVAGLVADHRSKIEIFQNAAGASNCIINFKVTGTVASVIGNSDYNIGCVCLDDKLGFYNPTYIKMDIEGAEADALNGARSIIQSFNPVLAVCLYHAQEHLWQIPLMIAAMNDDYHFFLRRYSDEGWELILYAVPAERLKGSEP